MPTRERINGVCASIRKYSPITNLLLWVITAAGFVYLHYDLKRHNLILYEIASEERMELFEERDRMIIRLMEVRSSAVQRATQMLEEAKVQRNEQTEMIQEILNRLPKDEPK